MKNCTLKHLEKSLFNLISWLFGQTTWNRSLNNLSSPIPVDERLRHFHHLTTNPITEVETYHKFCQNATRNSHELEIVIQLSILSFQQNKSFPCLRLRVEPFR